MFSRLRSDVQCILERDPAARTAWEVLTIIASPCSFRNSEGVGFPDSKRNFTLSVTAWTTVATVVACAATRSAPHLDRSFERIVQWCNFIEEESIGSTIQY